jgi:RNA polymerase sigma-70 factor (ECF subfamily)
MPKLAEEPDDLEALEAARRGDHAAAARIVRRHGASMVRTVWSVAGRHAEAEDVVQEALIAALTTDAPPTGSVGPWLRAIAARKALDALRRGARRAERPLTDPQVAALRTEGSHATIVVRRALARLAPRDRAVLTLVELEGFTMAEAARLLGSTTVAVKWRAVRARRRLRALLAGGSEER